MIPGELFIKDGDIELNAGRKTVTLSVANSGDRPIQVGSHYHFFETNPALKFERKKARGIAHLPFLKIMRLTIDLNNESRGVTAKVRNICPDRRLPTKLHAIEVVGFEIAPEQRLRASHSTTE